MAQAAADTAEFLGTTKAFLGALERASNGAKQVFIGPCGEALATLIRCLYERAQVSEACALEVAREVLGMETIFSDSSLTRSSTTQEVEGSSRVFDDLAAVFNAANQAIAE